MIDVGDRILAETCKLLQAKNTHRKRNRYYREEVSTARIRRILASADREQWVLDILETEETLG